MGTKGMMKGVGKGIGGVFLKPPAGMLSHSIAFTVHLANLQQAYGDSLDTL